MISVFLLLGDLYLAVGQGSLDEWLSERPMLAVLFEIIQWTLIAACLFLVYQLAMKSKVRKSLVNLYTRAKGKQQRSVFVLSSFFASALIVCIAVLFAL